MALEVYWYDFICFGIVGIAFCGALWVIWRKEYGSGSGSSKTKITGDPCSMYESLLVTCPDGDDDHDHNHVYVNALPLAHISTSQLWTSCWKGLHPGCLFVTRLGSFVVMAAFLAWAVLDWDASIFVYYTEWTFALVMIYFALGTVVSAHGFWLSSKESPRESRERAEFQKRDLKDSRTTIPNVFREKEFKGNIKLQSHYAQEEIKNRAGFWGYLMQISYQTCGGAVVLTNIVFWFVIVPFLSDAHLGLNLLMGCMHSLNAVFLLLDTCLNNLPFPWFRLSYFVLWSCIYVVFQWVIHACGFTWWPYPFLELDKAWATLWYFCMAVVHIPCYGIYALIIKAKYSILPRFLPHAFVRSY